MLCISAIAKLSESFLASYQDKISLVNHGDTYIITVTVVADAVVVVDVVVVVVVGAAVDGSVGNVGDKAEGKRHSKF